MTMTTDYKSLLFAHFANETTPLQRRQIEEWLVKEANRERFYAWLVEWENTLPLYQPDVEKPLSRFVSHMHGKSTPEAVEPTNQAGVGEVLAVALNRRHWGWMAAAVGVILLMSLGWLNRGSILYQTYQTAYGEIRTLQLTDGSTVTLNANSTLRVPRFGFGTRSREVQLSGEAFFAVQHTTDNQKFVVGTAQGFDVIVHGTEFTVSTRTNRANVLLTKGSVAVDYAVGKTRQQLLLRPGDLMTINRVGRLHLRHRVAPQTHLAWKEHRFVFDNLTLAEFGRLIHDTYGLTVEISDTHLAKRTLAGSVPMGTADELLQTVSELFNLTVTRRDSTVLLQERE